MARAVWLLRNSEEPKRGQARNGRPLLAFSYLSCRSFLSPLPVPRRLLSSDHCDTSPLRERFSLPFGEVQPVPHTTVTCRERQSSSGYLYRQTLPSASTEATVMPNTDRNKMPSGRGVECMYSECTCVNSRCSMTDIPAGMRAYRDASSSAR
jgi:hypothetical protein